MHLTPLGLRSLEPPLKGTTDYWDQDLPGFGLRVSQGGAKTYILKIDNSRRAIGREGIISLAEARAEARRQLAEKTLGKVRPQSITYDQAKTVFLAEKAKSCRPRTVDNLRHRLGRHFNFKGQLADISHQDVARKLNRIATIAEHDHAFAVARTFFTWCHDRRYINDNPVRGLSKHGTQSRTRVLTDVEVVLVWRACEQTVGTILTTQQGATGEELPNRLPAHFATIVQLLILTGMRRNECASLRTSYIDGQLATLPAEVVKNSSQFTVPLPTLATDILRTIEVDTSRNDALFFPARGKPNKPFNGWSKSMQILRDIRECPDQC